MLALCNHAPKNMKQWGFPDWKWHENARWGGGSFEENTSQQWRLLHENGRWVLWWWEKKWWQVSQKKSAVTICKLDYWVCISLIYSVLWNQWNFRAYIVEIKMMTVFRKMMTQSVKIVKLKEVKWLVFNVLIRNDDNDSLKKIWAHTIGG